MVERVFTMAGIHDTSSELDDSCDVEYEIDENDKKNEGLDIEEDISKKKTKTVRIFLMQNLFIPMNNAYHGCM